RGADPAPDAADAALHAARDGARRRARASRRSDGRSQDAPPRPRSRPTVPAGALFLRTAWRAVRAAPPLPLGPRRRRDLSAGLAIGEVLRRAPARPDTERPVRVENRAARCDSARPSRRT